MTETSRFSFPGFQPIRLKETKDTATHEVEMGTLENEGQTFVLEVIRRRGAPSFLIAKISGKKGLLWDFKAENFNGIGLIVSTSVGPAIALKGRNWRDPVERIILLSTLLGKQVDLRIQLRAKEEAAKELGCEYITSPAEEKVIRFEAKRKKEEAEAKKKAAEEAEKARYEERRLAREALLKRVFTRPEVRGFTASGKPRRGIPVLRTEWPSLPEGTFVIVVESYDDETRKAGGLVEAFRVEKKPGRNPEKGSCTAVSAESLSDPSSKIGPQPIKTIVVELSEGMFEIPVYNSAEEIRQARVSGLNGGSFVGIERGQRVEVYTVSHDKVTTVGHFIPLD